MKKKSALLLFLSRRGTSPKKTYSYGNKNYEGEQTNDAPFYCLFDIAENSITKVLCLVSKKVFFEEVSSNEVTMFQRYENMVKEKNSGIEVIPIPYDFSLEDRKKIMSPQEQAVTVYQMIAKELDEEYEIYADFTGGMRDVAFLMTTIIRYLEFRGNSCKKIIYSNYEDKKIYNIDYIYNLFQMVNGVSEFITTGNVNQLILAFKEDKNTDSNKEVNLVLNSLQDFSQTISLCDLSRLDSVLDNLRKSLKKFEDSKSDNIQSAMLRSMIPEIKKRMYMENDEKMSYPNLILWCVENGLLQQALTLYTEKMPIYYKEKNFYPKEVMQMGRNAKLCDGESKEANLLYTQFFEYLSEGRRKTPINEFKEELEKIENRIMLSDETELRKKWKKEIKKQIRKSEDGYIKNAWEQLLIVLDYYQNKERNQLPDILKDRNSLPPKKFTGYINEVKTNPKSLFKDNVENKKGVYKKRISGLENLSNRDLFQEEEEKKYKKILSYYLAVKMIRNHVNHASGVTGNQHPKEKEDEFKEVMLWLKEKAEIEIDFDDNVEEVRVNFDNIIRLLKSGIKESKYSF